MISEDLAVDVRNPLTGRVYVCAARDGRWPAEGDFTVPVGQAPILFFSFFFLNLGVFFHALHRGGRICER